VQHITAVCELPNHEVFGTASKRLLERQQSGRFIFDSPLRIDAKDTGAMTQEEYDARCFLCSLFTVVRATTLGCSGQPSRVVSKPSLRLPAL
jgi:hypothetical protein